MNITHLTAHNDGDLEGAKIEIDAGILGKFSMTSAISETTEEGVSSKTGESSPVLLNGEHFLPWHVTAALTDNGNIERSWIADKDDATVVAEILNMRNLYKNSDNWSNAVVYANHLTGQNVY